MAASGNVSAILQEPLSPPPPGVTPNFEHPQSRAYIIYATAGVCLPFIFLFASLRLYSKVYVNKVKTWDDLTCIFGLIGGLLYISITVAAVGFGSYGIHQWDIRLVDFTTSQLLLSYLATILYGPCTWLIKLSLFVLYLEIFSILRWLRISAIVGIVVTFAYYIGTMIPWIVYCGPSPGAGRSQFAYLEALASPACAHIRPLSVATGAVNVAVDLYLIILPMPAVWSLQLRSGRKWSISIVFGTGLIACIASILGLCYRVDQARSTDNTWEVIPAWCTTIIEMTAGIMVCCMPTTASVLKAWGPALSAVASTLRLDLLTRSSGTAPDSRGRKSSGKYPANSVSYGDGSGNKHNSIHAYTSCSNSDLTTTTSGHVIPRDFELEDIPVSNDKSSVIHKTTSF